MNRATSGFVSSLRPERLDALEISGLSWLKAGFRSYEFVSYPTFDICRDRTSRSYDIVIAEQVFEHIRSPDLALGNILGMLRRNGVLVITTPFLIRYHPEPLDLWRWTPAGLRAMLEDAGFTVLAADAWGNRACATANFDAWPDYDPARHSLENQPDVPVSVWAFARRDRARTFVDFSIGYAKAARRKLARIGAQTIHGESTGLPNDDRVS